MCSIPDLRRLSAITAICLAFAGCQRVQPPVTQHVALAPEPAADEASVHRDWEGQTAVVPTGAVVAGSTRFPYALRDDTSPDARRSIREPIIFLGQIPMVPFTYLYTPPFTPRVYQGVAVQPTHTAMPRMPDAPGQSLNGRTDAGLPVPSIDAYAHPSP